MKLEFEGKLDGVIAEMISVLSSLGWRLVPKDAIVKTPPSSRARARKPRWSISTALPKKRGRPKKEPPEPKEAPACRRRT